MSLSRLLARPLLASAFVFGGVQGLKNASALVPTAKPVIDNIVPPIKRAGVPLPDDTANLIRLNAAAQIVSGLALATGRMPRLSATVLAASLVPTTVAGHSFWNESDPEAKRAHTMHFFKNVSMIGGALLAAGDTDGSPGLAWRTRRAAKDARREAGHLAATAKREAKLAKAKTF